MENAVKFLSAILLLFTMVLCSPICFAVVKLPAIISDNMVMQQDSKVRIWGWADADEKVAVSILKQKKTVIAGKDGKWQVILSPMKFTSPTEMTIQGKNTIVIHNTIAGEVWLASGQSNMHWPLSASLNGEQEVREANYSDIRYFSVPPLPADLPVDDCNGRWVVCRPDTAGGFSAVAYFFGRYLYKELGRPVGMIGAPYGGSFIEAWMSDESLKTTCDYSAIMARYKQDAEKLKQFTQKFQEETEQWKKDVQIAKQNGQPVPPEPQMPDTAIAIPRNCPSRLFNAMINPLVPYTIKGAIWYQGESNTLAGRSAQYSRLFPAMLNDWRTRWGYDFPFYSVQLTSFAQNYWQPDDSNNPDWAELRDVQLKMATLKNSGMAVTVDTGESNNIHPLNKQDVGKRLALIALAKTYNKSLMYSGPVYDSMNINGNKIILAFKDVDKGLAMKGEKLEEFVICGNDLKFVTARAVIIDRNHIEAYSEKIEKPVAVRYGWRRCPINCNLYNSAGLPASPFRTDNQPYLSDKNK